MMMWKTDFSDALWTLEEGQQWVISGPVASGKTWITTRLARRYADAVALVTFADQTRSAGSAWAEARWHGSIEYEFRTVDSTLTYEAIHCVSPFEVRPPELEERAAFQALREWLEEALQLKPLLESLHRVEQPSAAVLIPSITPNSAVRTVPSSNDSTRL